MQRKFVNLWALAIIVLSIAASSAHFRPSAALEAPSERVGYKACLHLVLKLVDCLIETTDVYLASSKHETLPGEPLELETLRPDQLLGAVGPLSRDNNKRAAERVKELETFSFEAEVLASTKPMRRMQTTSAPSATTSTRPIEVGDATTINLDEQQPKSKRTACWTKAMGWLREQLISLRLELLDEKPINFSELLERFKQFDDFMASACNQAKPSGATDISLDYALEVLQVMAEIHEEALGKTGKPASSSSQSDKRASSKQKGDNFDSGKRTKIDEKVAIEAIKLH